MGTRLHHLHNTLNPFHRPCIPRLNNHSLADLCYRLPRIWRLECMGSAGINILIRKGMYMLGIANDHVNIGPRMPPPFILTLPYNLLFLLFSAFEFWFHVSLEKYGVSEVRILWIFSSCFVIIFSVCAEARRSVSGFFAIGYISRRGDSWPPLFWLFWLFPLCARGCCCHLSLQTMISLYYWV